MTRGAIQWHKTLVSLESWCVEGFKLVRWTLLLSDWWVRENTLRPPPSTYLWMLLLTPQNCAGGSCSLSCVSTFRCPLKVCFSLVCTHAIIPLTVKFHLCPHLFPPGTLSFLCVHSKTGKKTVHIPCPSSHPSKDASTHISAPVHGKYLCQGHRRPQSPSIVPWSWLHRTSQRHLVQLSSLNIFLHVPLRMPHSPGITTVFLPISSLQFCMFPFISLSF